MGDAAIDLVILDCDGVLVDSEPIALDLLRRTLAANGYDLSLGEVQRRFQGRALAAIPGILREEGQALPDGALARMEDELLREFTARLRPVAGMEALLDRLRAPSCVASSSSQRRLAHSLAVTGLELRFAARAFSAEEVRRGKPAPDLFLHAAARLGAGPVRCLVIEDSPAGIEAARAAGMRSLGFTGGTHANGAAYRARLESAGADAIASDVAALARQLAALGLLAAE